MTVQTVNFMAPATPNAKQSVAASQVNSFDSYLTGNHDAMTKSSNGSKQVENAVYHKNMTSETSDTAKNTTDKQQHMKLTDESSQSVSDVSVEESIRATQETEQLPEEVLAKILSVLNEIVTVLKDTFQVGEQQLLDSAKAIQFEMTDFFDSGRIKELFLQVQGLEPEELLTSEDLYRALEQLQNDITDIIDDSGLEQMLLQDGFTLEQFDGLAFNDKVAHFTDDVVQTKEVVIDFHQEPEQIEREKFDISNTETSEVFDVATETVSGADTEFASEDHGTSQSDQRFEQATMFLQKLVSTAKTAETDGIHATSDSLDLYDIARQIIDQVKLHIRPENTTMEIQLNPEHLGKVELEITSKNGELSARLNVQNDHVKEAVESQMQVLRETLEVQGLKVENIEVTVAEFGFRFQDERAGTEQQQQRQRRNGVIALDDAETDELSFSDVSEVMKEMNGNSVDYVA